MTAATFQVTNLPPGRYTVRVELASFRTFERKGVVLSSSERVSIGTIALEVGGLGETVTVEATGSHVNTTETQHGGVITRTQIEQIQVLGRDVTSLMRLLPGVRYTAPVDSMGGTFGVDMPNVGGLPADWSKVIIDGVVGNEVGNSGMNAQMVNLDAIAEVRLLNNSYRAEYGQSGGSQLQIVTRGGTRSITAPATTTAGTSDSTAPSSSAPGRSGSRASIPSRPNTGSTPTAPTSAARC